MIKDYYTKEGVSDQERMEKLKKKAKNGDTYMSVNGLWEFKCREWVNIWVKVHGIQMTEQEAKEFIEMLERKNKEDEENPPYGHGWRGE